MSFTTKDNSHLPCIGLLTSSLDQYQASIIRGAMVGANEQHINLMIFVGGELESPLADQANCNFIYELALQHPLQAVILLTGTLVSFIDRERKTSFVQQFQMPRVSLGIFLDGCNNVLLDNQHGMGIAVQHLIKSHNLRRIAFVQGPSNNEEASRRYQAYCQALRENGIPLDPTLVVPGRFHKQDGADAVASLLDERQLTIDAIVCANDNMAIGALAELEKRRIAVPEQIAVIGFDGIKDTGATIPPLTTVQQPLFEQGKYSVELALALSHGEQVEQNIEFKPKLLLRRSCGCFSLGTLVVEPKSLNLPTRPEKSYLQAARTQVISEMLSEAPNTRNFGWLLQLYDAFCEDLFASLEIQQNGRFVTTLAHITRQMLLEHISFQGWQQMITIMRYLLSPMLEPTIKLYRRAEDLWHQARLLIADAVHQAESNKYFHGQLQVQALNAIGEPLLSVTTMDELTQVMSNGLPTLGIKSCFIATYTDNTRKKAHLIYGYRSGTPLSIDPYLPTSQSFPVELLIPPDLLPTDLPCTLLVQALYFDNEVYGYLVLEIERAQTHLYEALRKQISRGLHTAFLMSQLEEKKALLEKTLAGLKTTQAMLIHSEKMNAIGHMVAGVAHEINNPISFVYSNIHSLKNTLEEVFNSYGQLEELAQNHLALDVLPKISQIRENADLDFILDDTKDLIDQTLQGLKRVKDIVTELRKFSRLDEAEFKVCNLRENIESTLLVASGELRNRVATHVDIDPSVTLVCSPAELNQVFLNIVVNAAQAIEGKGSLYISATKTTQAIVLRFTDSGKGISPDVMSHIFEPFFTTKPVGVGTGLGLAIAHRIIVDDHKGSIEVNSIDGQGTTFTITLPQAMDIQSQ